MEHRPLTPGQVLLILATTALTTAAGLLAAWYQVWVQLPQTERDRQRLNAAMWAGNRLGPLARKLGYDGMGDELATGRRSPRYLLAHAAGRLRDMAVAEMERQRL